MIDHDTVQDVLGTTIRKGQRICYPCRQGAALWMDSGTVELVSFEVLERWPAPELGDVQIKIRKDNGKVVTLRRPDRAVVVEGFNERVDPCGPGLEPQDPEAGNPGDAQVGDLPGHPEAGEESE